MTDRERAYQRMFDAFVQSRNLDVEFDNWPPEAEADWATEVASFNQRHPQTARPNRKELH